MRGVPILLFALGLLQLSAQPDSTQSISTDSLFAQLEGEIRNVNNTHQFDQTYLRAYAALARAKEEGDPSAIARAHDLIATWHYYSLTSNNPDSVYFHDRQALRYLQQTDKQEQIAEAYDRVGKDLVSLGRFLEAEEHLFAVVGIYEALDQPLELGSAYASLNYLYRESKDFEQALIYGEKSLELFEKHHQEEDELIEPLLGLIYTYPEVGQAELALAKAQQVVDIITRKYDGADNVHMANVRAWRGEVYVALEAYDKALEDFFYSWNVIKTIVPEESDADGWKGYIGNVLRLQGKYREAIPYLKDCLVHHQERNIKNWELVEDNQFRLSECYEQMNQPDSALWHQNQARALQVNRLEKELTAVKSELRIKYGSAQQEDTINAQQALIRQQQRIQYLSFGVGGLLLVVLGGVFFTYLNNRKKNRQLLALNTDLAQTNRQLDQRNEQNELLLREIHHRVKNNLEVVSSLLELQSAQVTDPEVKDAILEGQQRVHSIGIVHRKLYQGAHLGAIEMKDYFLNLSESILDSFGAEDRVTIECAMDQLEVDIDTAVPLGLIVNELLTNTLKYAFPDGRQGRVRIQLKEEQEGILQLAVADNGVGKDAAIKGTGFGGQLVTLLTRQLNGKMWEEIKNGTTTFFTFNQKKQYG